MNLQMFLNVSALISSIININNYFLLQNMGPL